MHGLINSYMITSSLIAAHQLNIFKIIVDKPLNLLEICDLIKSQSLQKTYALLLFLSANNFIEMVDDRFYPNQSTLELSDPKKPYGLMLSMIADEYLPASLMISNAILSNQTAYELAHGQNIWEHRRSKSHLGENFQRCIDIQASFLASELVESWPWFKYQKIIDIGGGYGALASAIKLMYPRIKLALFETPEQCNRVKSIASIEKKIHVDEVIEGDFFSDIPHGYDAYVIKSILHDWADNDCLKILNKIKMAADNADLVIIERVLTKESNGEDNVKAKYLLNQNLLMSMLHGSQERDEQEWLKIFTDAELVVVEKKFLDCGFHLFKLRNGF